MRHLIRPMLAAMVAVVVALGLVVAPTTTTSRAVAAPPVADFDPGFIISDRNFFDPNAMTEAEIQGFLNAQVPRCAPGGVCLKDFSQVTVERPATPMCAAYTPDGVAESAARIIWKVAQACGISPKVILVTLQKEQGLVTSTDPSSAKYRYAMGADCPDTPLGCDVNFSGFFVQVHRGAYLMKRYTQPAGTGPGTIYTDRFDLRYPVGAVSNILYHPVTATLNCGTKPVLVKNMATHVLYIYTPYTPDNSAMENLYGTGNDCASYGNRNFWRNYYDWFGDPQGGDPSFIAAIFTDFLGRTPDDAALRAWDWQLERGRTRASLAADIVYSDEYRTQRIAEAYQHVLGRGPDSNGLAYWLSVTVRGGLPIDEVEHYFLRSDEYYASIGGSPEQFVEDVYQRMLARSATDTDQLYWAPIVLQYGREAVVWSIYNSPESSYRRVDAMYQKLLARDSDEGGRLYWGPRVIALGDNEIRAALVDSVEYAERARTRFPFS
ncbi:DUF4214 domain-containing protein [Protaetiibacter larvae]|nr:DUF4214 domain-containing protein [Protaetiibacter larvae]